MCERSGSGSMPREGALDVHLCVVNRHVLVLTMRTCRHCVERSGSGIFLGGMPRQEALDVFGLLKDHATNRVEIARFLSLASGDGTLRVVEEIVDGVRYTSPVNEPCITALKRALH